MRTRVPTHKSDGVLLRDLKSLVSQDCLNTAEIVAHVAEAEDRRLYRPAGYSSMHRYCVDELRLSDDAAYKRIQAARAARKFPAVLDALASGRLHLTAVVLLRPNLNADNVNELVAAATHRTRAEIELIIAHRFPKSDTPERLEAILPAGQTSAAGFEGSGTVVGCLEAQQVSEPVPSATSQLEPVPSSAPQLVSEPVQSGALQPAPEPVPAVAARPVSFRSEASAPHPRVTPLAPERFALQVTIGQSTHDKLRYAQELLSHRLPSGDIAQVIDLALETLVRQLEKQKFAATNNPRPSSRRSTNARYIPAAVKRAVCERDQVDARSSAKPVIDVDRASFWNMTISSPWHAGGRQR